MSVTVICESGKKVNSSSEFSEVITDVMNGEESVRSGMEENNVVPGVAAGDVISINVEGDDTTEVKVVTIHSSSGPVNVSVTFDGMLVATVSF